LKKLHRPILLGTHCISFKEKLGLKITEVSPVCLNAGLMKPRKGSTPVMGSKTRKLNTSINKEAVGGEKTGWGGQRMPLTLPSPRRGEGRARG